VTVFQRHEEAVVGFRTAVADLEGSPSFVMLAGGSLGPETARAIGATVDHAQGLWPLVHAMAAVLDEIRTATGVGDGVAGRLVDKAALERLLAQPWLPDPARPDGPPLPLAELAKRFRERFDDVRTRVSEIDQLWLSVLPRVDAARGSLARLRSDAEQLGVTEPLIGRAEQLRVDLEARLVSDPLSVSAQDGTELDALVAEASKQIASLRAGLERLDDDLASTEVLLSELRALRARAEAAATEATAKVASPNGLIRVPSVEVLDGAGGLASRLDDVFAQLDDLRPNQRRALVDGWLAMANRLRQQLARAEEANGAPLRQRGELRGRLTAYQAKMSALGRAEDLEATAVADRARTQLYTAPTDLGEAAATIDQLARMLRS
jgi:chromosome segregation ATPase